MVFHEYIWNFDICLKLITRFILCEWISVYSNSSFYQP